MVREGFLYNIVKRRSKYNGGKRRKRVICWIVWSGLALWSDFRVLSSELRI
jgi:hypothetical protein